MSEDQNVEVPVDNSAVEQEARQFGWVPKEEFRGSEESWVDAETFVERGKALNPILRKNNERLLKELNYTKQQINELKAATEEFKRFQQESFAQKEAHYKSQIDDLKAQKKQAIREGDGDLAVELDDRIDLLKEDFSRQKEQMQEVKAPPAEQQAEIPQEVNEWLDTNTWYANDSKMRSAADAIASELNKTKPWLTGKAFLDALDEELADTFSAEKLGKRVKPRSPVESGKSVPTSRSTDKKTYDNLPAEAKAACDRFVKNGMIKSREEYVKMYSWD